MLDSVAPLVASFTPILPGLRGSYVLIVPLLFVVLAIYYARLYRIDAKRLTRSQKRVLLALRVGAGSLVLLLLLTPAVQTVTTEERLPVVALVVDESTSMNYPEAPGQALVQNNPKSERTRHHALLEAVDQLQQELSRTHRVKVFAFADSLRLARDIPHRSDPSSPALTRGEILTSLRTPHGDYTEAGDALVDVLERLGGDKVSSVLLLSDGRITGGLPLAAAGEQAATRNVPVQALTFGSEEPPIDLRIDRVDVPPETSLGDNLMIALRITNHVRTDLKCAIKLYERAVEDAEPADRPAGLDGYKLDQQKTVTLARGRNDVVLTTIPNTEGLREYRVVLPEFEDEIDYANNQAVFRVKVVKRTLRVLFVAGKATREYQHAVVCMLRDPVIRLSCFLQSAQIAYVQQGNVVIDRLPQTVAQWQEYDIVVLYDVDPREISAQQISGLETTVSKGAGLLVVAGRSHGLGPLLQIHSNKMRQLLPVEIDKDRPLRHEVVFDKPVTVERTPEGRATPVCRLVSSETLNDEIWASFPELYWYHPVVSAKQRAITVLRKKGGATGLEDAGDCIMAVQRFGEGLVTYLGTDETWRWRNPYGAYDYELFWSHLVRYLGETRLLGAQKQVALGSDKQAYAPGEKVKLRLQVLDQALYQQLVGEQLTATVVDPGKAKQVIGLERDPGGQPFYQGVYLARHAGPHQVESWHSLSTGDTAAKRLFEVRAGFKVEMLPLESLDPTADPEGMEKLARATGGTSLDHRTMTREALTKLAASIPTDRLVLSQEQVREVWDSWLAVALVLALLTAEWTLRKLWGVL
jgi:hypothetical protein